MKRALSLLLCAAAVVAFSFVLASYGEPVTAALWDIDEALLLQHAADLAQFVVLVGGGFFLGLIWRGPRASRW